MDVSNKIYLKLPTTNQTINVPIEIKWDFYGQQDSIDLWEKDVLEEVIGIPKDFEISRFAHHEYGNHGLTQLNYDFYFYSANSTTWVNNYKTIFSVNEIFYRANSFKKSFFKLDFYNSADTKSQINYFTIILPTNLGTTENGVTLSNALPNVNIKKPSFYLDYILEKEGFFIYWLRYRDFLNIDTFYMTAKFFDGKNGEFIKMMTVPQDTLSNPNLFDGSELFYYKVQLDYNDKTYKIYNYLNNRVGDGTPINWYQYNNP
jgi:hypothetical protein